MPSREIVIDPAFEGPPASAHGGYACGIVAPYLAADAEITLRKPVPLGTGLRLAPYNGGLALHDENDLVAEGASTRLEDHTPQPPTFAEALAATASFPGLRPHPYRTSVSRGHVGTDASGSRIIA